MRGGQIIGAMVVRRKTPGDFSDEVLDFMQTFASQSALAVFNARVFRELERKSAELQVASQHKSDFLASMSHELRTPLNAVIGFSEVLLERMFGDLNERQEEYLRDILNSGKHLLELLNEILDLSKVEAGRMELELSVFPIEGVIEQSLAFVRERAALHRIGLAVEIDTTLDLIESDERRFKQVLLNLLSNAVKFTPDGGHIAVRASHTKHRLTVTVTDDGIGIPPEDRERIFESFQQGRRGAWQEEGTGLGLTLCRRIVALMGGVMTLQTEVGVGSTFGFTIPIRSAGVPGGSGSRNEDDPVVIVIDDDRSSLELMSAYLDGHGVRVLGARDGKEGVDIVRRLKPVAARARHPIAGNRRLAGDGGAPGGSRDACTARDHHLDPGREVPGVGGGRRRVPDQTRGSRRPARRLAPGARAARPECRMGRRMSARILVVEDNPLNLKLIRDVLEFQGFDVITVQSGEEGVAVASASSPDLVLMDLQLPGIDGHEALQRIRADPRCHNVPVVAVTAFAMKDDVARAEAAGFDGYIAKPISVRALPRQLAEFLPGGC